MVKKINLIKTEGVRWTFSDSAGEDKARAVIEYGDDFTGFLARMPSLRSAHPLFPTMGLVKRNGERSEGNQVKVTLEYETNEVTFPDDPDAPDNRVKRYDFDFVTEEQHLLTNDAYKDLSAAERLALLTIANGVDVEESKVLEKGITSDKGKEALGKIRKGFTQFLDPGLIWIERFTTKNLSEVEIEKIGEVMDPPGPRPDPGSQRNYLYLGAAGKNSEDGESFDIERRWRLSGKGKWDSIYNPQEEEG